MEITREIINTIDNQLLKICKSSYIDCEDEFLELLDTRIFSCIEKIMNKISFEDLLDNYKKNFIKIRKNENLAYSSTVKPTDDFYNGAIYNNVTNQYEELSFIYCLIATATRLTIENEIVSNKNKFFPKENYNILYKNKKHKNIEKEKEYLKSNIKNNTKSNIKTL